jgi:hypothetical protein
MLWVSSVKTLGYFLGVSHTDNTERYQRTNPKKKEL